MMYDYDQGQRDFQDWLTLKDIDLVKLIGPRREDKPAWGKVDHWRMTIGHHHVQYVFDYFMGLGHEGKPPTLSEVIAALIGDSTAYLTHDSWEDYASEFEPNLDDVPYRQIQRYRSTYTEMGRTSKKLAKLLPRVDLINDTELADLLERAGLT